MNQSDRKPRRGESRVNRVRDCRKVKQVRNVPVDRVDKIVNQIIAQFHSLTITMDNRHRVIAAKQVAYMLEMVE